MGEQAASLVTWVVLVGGGVVFLIILVKAPELLTAVLLVGPTYIQLLFALLGMQVSRRTFAAGGAVLFIPVVLLFVVMRVVGASLRREVFGRPNFPFVALAAVMGLYLLFGLTFTEAPRYGGQKTGEYFVFGMTPMLLGFIFLRDRASAHRLLWWVIGLTTVTVVLTSGYLLATRGTVFTLIHVWMESDPGTVTSVVRGHSALSTPLVLTMAALFALAGGRSGFRWKALPIVLFPIIAFYIVMSGTRSNLVALGAVVVAGAFLAYRRQRMLLVGIAIVLAVAAGVVYLMAPEEVAERMFGGWFEDDTSGGTSRLHNLEASITEGLESPLIGRGTGAWPVVMYGMDWYDYPHNMFGEIFVENGLIGLALLLAMWWVVVSRIARILRTAEPETDLYGLAIFGGGLMAFEFANGLGHFGLAHHSCNFLLSSAVVLRSTYLMESFPAQEEQEPDATPETLDAQLEPSA